MKISTILQNKKITVLLSSLFWIAVWHIVSVIIGENIILVSPFDVVKTLLSLITEGSFWQTVLFSFSRIASGFLSAVVSGVLLAVLASRFMILKALLAAPMQFIKSTPVASFVILLLLSFGSGSLSVAISFLMVLPVIYLNTLEGITSVDKKLLEMAKIYKMSSINKLKYIYFPQMLPYFLSALKISLGLCWKSGVAAEVIGLPAGSIGEKLYMAKIYLSSSELFAWTTVIILISAVFEKIILMIISKVQRALERGYDA